MLSILITHYKTLPLLKLCLASVKKHLDLTESAEIFVLDSAAEAETAYFIQEHYPNIKYRAFAQNLGYAKLVNQGLAQSRGEFILILNADTMLTAGAAAKLLDAARANPRAGIIAPQLLDFTGATLQSCFRFYTPAVVAARRTFLKRFSFFQKRLDYFLMKDQSFIGTQPRPVHWAQGSAFLVRRAAWAKVGGLDERFFLYFEDVDWCRRIWENGYTVLYAPAIKIYHWHGRASDRYGGFWDLLFNRYTFIHLSSALKYFQKYGWRTKHYTL